MGIIRDKNFLLFFHNPWNAYAAFSLPPAHIRVRDFPFLPKILTCSFTNRMDWKFDHISPIECDVKIYRLYKTTAGCVTTSPYLLILEDWEVTKP